jgi:ribosomal protein S3AE
VFLTYSLAYLDKLAVLNDYVYSWCMKRMAFVDRDLIITTSDGYALIMMFGTFYRRHASYASRPQQATYSKVTSDPRNVVG